MQIRVRERRLHAKVKITWRSCDHHVTPPKFGGVVVEEAEFVQLFFDHLVDGVWHHQLLHSVPELLRDGILVIFLREEEEEERRRESKEGGIIIL